jgi:hypothetical protein
MIGVLLQTLGYRNYTSAVEVIPRAGVPGKKSVGRVGFEAA